MKIFLYLVGIRESASRDSEEELDYTESQKRIDFLIKRGFVKNSPVLDNWRLLFS